MESVCVCVEEYNPSTSGHLQLAKGDLVESKTLADAELYRYLEQFSDLFMAVLLDTENMFNIYKISVPLHYNFILLSIIQTMQLCSPCRYETAIKRLKFYLLFNLMYNNPFHYTELLKISLRCILIQTLL